jgi:hypothetical protein
MGAHGDQVRNVRGSDDPMGSWTRTDAIGTSQIMSQLDLGIPVVTLGTMKPPKTTIPG